MSAESLHIPERIRFECSGCGNCCLQWPVPATAADVERIAALVPEIAAQRASETDFERHLQQVLGRATASFRLMPPGDRRFAGFTHSLEKRADGRCQFLTEANRCSLHEEHGAEAKPAMCQLFPHSFTQTPSGVFAYVSFASSGVLFNAGRPLTEQRELLAERFSLYKKLFSGHSPDWSQIQILDGFPLDWQQFTGLDKQFLATFDNPALPSAFDKLQECSRIAVSALPKGANAEKLPPLEAHPAIIDQIILKYLIITYMPADVFNESEFDLNTKFLMTEIVGAPDVVPIEGKTFLDVLDHDLGNLDQDVEDLFNRYLYARLFAKLYFGPTLAHLSLLAGLHHLYFVLAIARFQLKQRKLSNEAVDLAAAAEIIRTIERRLTQMNFSAQSSAVMEVLFSSPARLARVRKIVR